jgi:ATP phosphoribosyltransferase
MIVDRDVIRFAIPNKGRLHKPIVELLKKAGYSFRVRDRLLYATCDNADIVFVLVRNKDISLLVHEGVVDMGITGEDSMVDNRADVATLLPLNMGKCQMCIAVNKSSDFVDSASMAGKTFATSFPVLAKDYFAAKGIDVKVVKMDGALEVMVALGFADGIVDIVETGDTLRANNLKVIESMGTYSTVLVGQNSLVDDERVKQIVRRLEGPVIAKRYTMLEYNVRAELLAAAEKVTPGFNGPTVSKLDNDGGFAVKVMVDKKKTLGIMDELEGLGATAIVETEIRNCRL